jgi:hypothetical protein
MNHKDPSKNLKVPAKNHKDKLLIYSRQPLTDAEVDHQLARVIALLAELPSGEAEERTYSEAEVLESAGLE